MTAGNVQRVRVIDSHTGGEPTRVVVSGGPDLGAGPLAERLERFRTKHDAFRSAVVNEPRGSDVMVGALLCEPADPACACRRNFFQQRWLSGHVRPRNHRARGHAFIPEANRTRRAPHRDAGGNGECRIALQRRSYGEQHCQLSTGCKCRS